MDHHPAVGTESRVLEMVSRLDRQARATPDVVVLTDGERSLTMDELVQWAAALSTWLPDESRPIAVVVDRRVASVAACWGVLWAGCGVTPLDADDPRYRVEELIARSGADVVVDAVGLGVTQLADRPVVAMSDLGRMRVEPRPMAADDLATLFYTSGSTGRPKGAPRSARVADAAFADWLSYERPPDPNGVFMPLHFLGGFATTMQGLTIARRTVLIDPQRSSPQEIADIIDAEGLTRISLTPSLVRALAQALDGRRLYGVTEIWCTGEALDWSHVRLARALASPDVVVNTSYGASEIIGALSASVAIAAEQPPGEGLVPIGWMPTPDRARLELVEGLNGVGQLIVREPLVEGYWRDPDLTAERFGVDPDGVRFWRSGDLVTVDGAGLMHLRGRLDEMTKLNGRLVEPSESESALCAVPGIRNAVVVARTLPSGRQQLVGHVEAEPDVSPRDVYRDLVDRVPAWVVPGVVVRHDVLPIGARGKADRTALRTSPVSPWRDRTSSRSPSPTESFVLDTVLRVLDVVTVDLDDDLWRIGCDSLAAIELAESISAARGVRLTPNDLVDASTPTALARILDDRLASVSDAAADRARDGVVVWNAAGSRPMIHVICGGGAPAVQYRLLVGHLGHDQPVAFHEQFGLHRRGRRDLTAGRAVRRYTANVERLSPVGRVVLAGHSLGGFVANDVARSLASRGREVSLVLLDPVPTATLLVDAMTPPVTEHGARSALGHPRQLVWRARSAVTQWRRGMARPGSPDRYAAFYRRSAAQMRRAHIEPFDGPTVYLSAADEAIGVDDPVTAGLWPAMPRGRVLAVPGDHNGMAIGRATATVLRHAVDGVLWHE